MNHTLPRFSHRFTLAVLALCWLILYSPPAATAQGVRVPDEPTPIMELADVRIGMKGYGMTVFQGTRIEPFNVEVISVVPNSSPQRSVIWIRCPDPRMVESGPVQGMSGSPIYLWDENEPHELGQGGRLIGAFAFGFTESQQCLVGVQPIGYMRESATRIKKEKVDSTNPGTPGISGSPGDQAKRGSSQNSTRSVIQLLDRLDRLPAWAQVSALGKVRLDAIRELMNRASGRTTRRSNGAPSEPLFVAGPHRGARATRLMLPMSLGPGKVAEVFAPLLEPMGILGVSSGQSPIAGQPPHGVDAESTSLQPGSVLSVPLAYGDLDLSAAGTVTDVLPSGAVLGFGHPMFGQGDSAIPMATGYVHFIVPRRSISFKNGGTLIPQGTLVRDEGAGVVGIAEKRYTTAPIDVTVNMLGQAPRKYHYQVVNHPTLSAILTAIVAYNSIEAVHALPIENTARVRATMRFQGGRELVLDNKIAGGSGVALVLEMLPTLAVMVQNPFEPLEIESVTVTVDIQEGNQMATIVGARLDRAEVAPGDTVAVNLDIQHYAGPLEHRRVELQIPDDLEEGDYPLTVSGADTYALLKLTSKPHLMLTRDIDGLTRFLQQMLSYRSDAIYMALQLPDEGLAVGQTEMPRLPSSRRAILETPTRTDSMPFAGLVDKVFNSDVVIFGEASFTLSVRKP